MRVSSQHGPGTRDGAARRVTGAPGSLTDGEGSWGARTPGCGAYTFASLVAEAGSRWSGPLAGLAGPALHGTMPWALDASALHTSLEGNAVDGSSRGRSVTERPSAKSGEPPLLYRSTWDGQSLGSEGALGKSGEPLPRALEALSVAGTARYYESWAADSLRRDYPTGSEDWAPSLSLDRRHTHGSRMPKAAASLRCAAVWQEARALLSLRAPRRLARLRPPRHTIDGGVHPKAPTTSWGPAHSRHSLSGLLLPSASQSLAAGFGPPSLRTMAASDKAPALSDGQEDASASAGASDDPGVGLLVQVEGRKKPTPAAVLLDEAYLKDTAEALGATEEGMAAWTARVGVDMSKPAFLDTAEAHLLLRQSSKRGGVGRGSRRYIGMIYRKGMAKWCMQLWFRRRTHTLSLAFESALLCARARDRLMLHLRGREECIDKYYLNFPVEADLHLHDIDVIRATRPLPTPPDDSPLGSFVGPVLARQANAKLPAPLVAPRPASGRPSHRSPQLPPHDPAPFRAPSEPWGSPRATTTPETDGPSVTERSVRLSSGEHGAGPAPHCAETMTSRPPAPPLGSEEGRRLGPAWSGNAEWGALPAPMPAPAAPSLPALLEVLAQAVPGGLALQQVLAALGVSHPPDRSPGIDPASWDRILFDAIRVALSGAPSCPAPPRTELFRPNPVRPSAPDPLRPPWGAAPPNDVLDRRWMDGPLVSG